MKWFVAAFGVLIPCVAWPQIERGTVIFVNFSQDEVTVAADSRMIASNGTQSDYECKISTFGDKFAFVMAGNASRARGRDNAAWNAHSVAREAWKRESPEHLNDAIGLTLATEQAWIKQMKPIYADPEVIRDRRMRMKPGDDPNLASAVFVATDSMGELIVLSVDVVFDVGLYDSVGKIAVSENPPLKLRKNSQLIAGYGEIIDEFLDKTSVRAKEYMAWFESTIAGFPSREKDARLASKMIELSILLHPKREDLGFPIDLIQMRRKIGLDILSMKKNCSDEENKYGNKKNKPSLPEVMHTVAAQRSRVAKIGWPSGNPEPLLSDNPFRFDHMASLVPGIDSLCELFARCAATCAAF